MLRQIPFSLTTYLTKEHNNQTNSPIEGNATEATALAVCVGTDLLADLRRRNPANPEKQEARQHEALEFGSG